EFASQGFKLGIAPGELLGGPLYFSPELVLFAPLPGPRCDGAGGHGEDQGRGSTERTGRRVIGTEEVYAVADGPATVRGAVFPYLVDDGFNLRGRYPLGLGRVQFSQGFRDGRKSVPSVRRGIGFLGI